MLFLSNLLAPLRWISGLCATTSALLIAGCAWDGTSMQISKQPACKASSAYDGRALRPAVNIAALPVRPATAVQSFPASVQTALSSRWQEGLTASGATTGAITIMQLGAAGTDEPASSWSSFNGGDGDARSFWWASAGKIVTASVILQLEREGALAITDNIDRWFPDFPGAELITIEQLLTHTSGAFTFDNDAQIRLRQYYIPPAELIAASARQGLDFCPGTNWLYSNTGYVMLALIAESVDQQSFAQIVERRIASPLGLSTLHVLGPNTDPQSVVAPKGKPGGSIAAFATIAGAGPVVGDAPAMVALLSAWLDGRLIGEDARNRALTTLYPMFESSASYGRGIMVIDVPDQEGATRWIGHLGGSPDAKAVLVYDLVRRTYVALALNTDANGEALALSILAALDESRKRKPL